VQGSAKLRENLKPNEKPVEVEEKVQDNIRQVKTVAGKKYYYLLLLLLFTITITIWFIYCDVMTAEVLFEKKKQTWLLCLLSGMACQVSGAVVAAVSAMTVELGRRLAPVIVEKGGKVSSLRVLESSVQCAVPQLGSLLSLLAKPLSRPVPSLWFCKRL